MGSITIAWIDRGMKRKYMFATLFGRLFSVHVILYSELTLCCVIVINELQIKKPALQTDGQNQRE